MSDHNHEHFDDDVAFVARFEQSRAERSPGVTLTMYETEEFRRNHPPG